MPALGPSGISWSAESDGEGPFFVGLASNEVASVELVSADGKQATTLMDNLFWLDWSVSFTPNSLHRLASRFVVTYKDGRPPTTVSLGL
jgi:hypothetical protein